MHRTKWIPLLLDTIESDFKISNEVALKIVARVLILCIWEYCPRDNVFIFWKIRNVSQLNDSAIALPNLRRGRLFNQRCSPLRTSPAATWTLGLLWVHRHGETATLCQRICEAYFHDVLGWASQCFHHLWWYKVAILFDQVARVVVYFASIMRDGKFVATKALNVRRLAIIYGFGDIFAGVVAAACIVDHMKETLRVVH